MGVRGDTEAGIRRGRKIGHLGGTGIGVWIDITTGIDIGIKTVVVGKRGSVAVHRVTETVASGDLRAGLGSTSIMMVGDRSMILAYRVLGPAFWIPTWYDGTGSRNTSRD